MDRKDDIDPRIEAQRIAAVRRYDILDTPPDGAFDRITAVAARRFGVPIAIVGIVDTDRIWFKSRHGIDIDQVPRRPGFCALAMPDVELNAEALALMASDFGLRFHACAPLTTHDGFVLGTLCVLDREPRPIDEAQIEDLKDLAAVIMDRMELRLSARSAVEHAELLVREIDHRVMNSLQLVASMLFMQSRAVTDCDAAHALEIAAGRVGAIARVHRHFCTDNGEPVSCIAFLRHFCADLSGILARPIEVAGDEAKLPPRAIHPIGLIVNELATNAAKHGRGRIEISLRIIDGQLYQLRVSDEGDGLPAGFDPSAASGLGMKVVTLLADKLGGDLSCGPDPRGRGACFTVAFPLDVGDPP